MSLLLVDDKSETRLGQSIVLGVSEQIVGKEAVDVPDFEQTYGSAREQTQTVVMHGMTFGIHEFMPQSTGKSEKVVLVADGIGWTEIG